MSRIKRNNKPLTEDTGEGSGTGGTGSTGTNGGTGDRGATGLDYNIEATAPMLSKDDGGVNVQLGSGAGLGAEDTTIPDMVPGSSGLDETEFEGLGEKKDLIEKGELENNPKTFLRKVIADAEKGSIKSKIAVWIFKKLGFLKALDGTFTREDGTKVTFEEVQAAAETAVDADPNFFKGFSQGVGPSGSGLGGGLGPNATNNLGGGAGSSGSGRTNTDDETNGGDMADDNDLEGGSGVGGPRITTPESGGQYDQEVDFKPYVAGDARLPEGTEVTPELLKAQESDYLEKRNLGTAQTATAATVTEPNKIEATKAEASLIGDAAPQATAAQGEVSTQAQVTAAQTDEVGTQAAVSSIESVNKVAAAQVNEKVIIDAANATLSKEATATAAHARASEAFKTANNELQAKIDDSVVDPRATVQEQYRLLMDDPDPAWAKAATRAAKGAMAARGITGSTIAGEAITMAIMQAAMPIAQQDARVFQNMGELKLNSTVQVGMLKMSHLANLDIKNSEFQQQASLQNASAALQINMSNLSNEQQAAVVNAQMEMTRLAQNADRTQQVDLANVANMLAMDTSNLDAATRTAISNAQNMLQIKTANLSTRQQAAVQNAKSFFDMDMVNLSNSQQTAIVNSQVRMQAILSDQSAQNAAAQFNAQSENQTNQFFAGLTADISKFNSAQSTDVSQFNAAMLDAREQFNTRNALIVDQANVQWNRQINTQNTATTNQFNMVNAQNLLNISNTQMANEITLMRDKNAFVFEASDSKAERAVRLALADLDARTRLELQDNQQKHEAWIAVGQLTASIAGEVDWGDVADSIGDWF